MERAIRWNLFSWECIWHSVLQIKEPAFSVYSADTAALSNPVTKELWHSVD